MATPSDHAVAPLRVIGAWIGLGLVLTARVYRAMFLTLVVAALLPSLWSWSTYVVRSGSMEPAISVGDVVITKPFSSTSPVPVGRVMLFTPSDTADGHENRLHRVVEYLGDGSYVTAGDANRSNDATPVRASEFHGRAIICVPFVGLPLVWLQDRDAGLLVAWVVATTIAFYFSTRPSGRSTHRKRSAKTSRSDSGTDELLPSSASRSEPVHRMTHSGPAVLAGAIATTFAALLPVQSADAAFTAETSDARNTWAVAANTSRVTSKLQVYDTTSSAGWYQRSAVTASLRATAGGGATVRSITYSVNGAKPVTVRSSTAVFTIATQGDNLITYFATDSAGAAEKTHTEHVKLDNRAPATTITSPPGDMSHAQWRTACAGAGPSGGVCGTATDVSGSGLRSVEYLLYRWTDLRCFNGQVWTSAACQAPVPATIGSGTWAAAVPDASLGSGRTRYSLTVYAEDVAGNTTSSTRSVWVG